MKLTSMNCHYRFYDLEWYFQEISKLGFTTCEIWTSPHHFNVNSYERDSTERLIELSKHYGVEIVCICPEQTNPKPHNIATADKRQQARVLQYFKNVIDVSVEVGANMIVITTGWAYYNEDREEAYQRSVDMMRKICEYAESRNTIVALEALQPDESVLVNTVEELKEYLELVNKESLKVCIDLGAMARVENTLDQYFEEFNENVVHIHFVDGNPTGHLAWGDGTRNMRKDIETIKRYGYQGYLSLENANSRYFENPVVADKRSIENYLESGGEKI